MTRASSSRMTRDGQPGRRRRARARRTLSACSSLQAIRARVRDLGPRRVDALIAAVFLVEGLLEAAAAVRRRALRLARRARDGADRRPALASAAAQPLVVARARDRRLRALPAARPRDQRQRLQRRSSSCCSCCSRFGLHEPRGRRLLGGFAFVFAANALSLTIDSYSSTVIDVVFGGLVIAGGPILLGRVIANRSRLNTTLREKAERLRRERADQAEQAAAGGAHADRRRAARRRRPRDERDGRAGGRRAAAGRARPRRARATRSPPSRTPAARR